MRSVLRPVTAFSPHPTPCLGSTRRVALALEQSRWAQGTRGSSYPLPPPSSCGHTQGAPQGAPQGGHSQAPMTAPGWSMVPRTPSSAKLPGRGPVGPPAEHCRGGA